VPICDSNTLITVGDSDKKGAPIIGDNCYIGAGAKIIGRVSVGNNVRIGANAVVVKDVPDNCVVVNQPSRVIQKNVRLNNKYSGIRNKN
jgi:serine O-acetyltransferase